MTTPGFLYLSPVILDESGPFECDEDAELKARIPAGCHIGEHWEDDNLINYFVSQDFEVDGIWYRYASNIIRPMLSIEDQTGSSSYSRMTFSQPATEEELDHWVRTGKPLPRKG